MVVLWQWDGTSKNESGGLIDKKSIKWTVIAIPNSVLISWKRTGIDESLGDTATRTVV